MKEDPQPIKRSPQLAPLSREHHDGLLFAWKIKQGIANRTSPETMAAFAKWYWRNHIKPHFFQEEKILMPYMPAGHPMAKRLKEEHDHIRELVLELDEEADTRHLQLLADLVTAHIRFEERELFNYLETLLQPDQLAAVQTALEAHPLEEESSWTNEFWLTKPAG